jgi:indole-3-glycerol phosphate synthase
VTRELPDVLRRIVSRRRQVLAASPPLTRALPAPRQEPLTAAENAWLASVVRQRGRAVIAEVKMGSPHMGRLGSSFDPELQASAYARGGAAALSVVVEPDFFFGSYELLAQCRLASRLPVLAKDFVLDERQLMWARAAGASAVLLIARLLARQELVRLATLARALGMVPLVETHDAFDLEKLAEGDWEAVGINHRDLATFEVDLEMSVPLMNRLPRGALKVAESGISRASQVVGLERRGFDAFLIGESLLVSGQPEETVRELTAGNGEVP